MADSAERRALAAAQPEVWRVGGSESTEGCTIYQGNRFVGSTRWGRDAAILTEAANGRAAVLAIHRPCHTPGAAPANCQLGAHYDPAECMVCSESEIPIPWPCPTAQALGVTS